MIQLNTFLTQIIVYHLQSSNIMLFELYVGIFKMKMCEYVTYF